MDTVDSKKLVRAFGRVLAEKWAARMGATGSLESADELPAGMGWTVEVPLSGTLGGRVVAWFPRDTARQCAAAALEKTGEPTEADVLDLLRDVTGEAAGAVAGSEGFNDVAFGTAVANPGVPPSEATPHTLQAGDQPACAVVLYAEVYPQAALTESEQTPSDRPLQMDAVLDLELPVIVRFGEVTMSLQALADLGPGAVVDMERSPDDPVEIVIGSRVIARGEVVVVGGNYGIRITELTGAAPALADLEAQAS